MAEWQWWLRYLKIFKRASYSAGGSGGFKKMIEEFESIVRADLS